MDSKRQQMVQEILEICEYEGYEDETEILEVIDQSLLGLPQYISVKEKGRIRKEIFHSLRRLDILSDLLQEEDINDIMVNGYQNIFIERSGVVVKYEGSFFSKQKLEDIVQMMVSQHNRIVNESNPIVDVRLPDGSRVNIVLPPVAINGPIITIRKFPSNEFTMKRYEELGCVTEEVAQFLKNLVISRHNIFISGGTGSGKTTFLNVLSNFIPAHERVITIEDSAELRIQGIPNLVRLETRNANLEGNNEVSMQELIKSSLRMRPDRIIVGEVRGGEALDMLQAMNTGHDGSLSTGHANSSEDMLGRIETLVLMAKEIPLIAIRRQIASALDIMVHLGRGRDMVRRVLEVSEVLYKEGEISLNTLFSYKDNKLVRTENRMQNILKLQEYDLGELT